MNKLTREMCKRGFTPIGANGNAHLLFEKDGVIVTTACTPQDIDDTVKLAVRDWRRNRNRKENA